MKKVIGYIYIFLAMFIWGTSSLVMKNALEYVNSGFLIFLRSIITFIILIPFSFKQIIKFKKNNYLLIIITGVVVASGYIIQTIGLKYTTPGKSAFLENAYCIVVPILTCFILKKKLNLSNALSIILCTSGVILISIDSIGGNIGIGEILSLIAGILYGINIVITGIYAKDIDPIGYTCGQFFVMSIISGLYTLIFENNNEFILNGDTIFKILYLGIVVTTLAWIFRNKGQQIVPPITVSIILPFSAVVGTTLSVILGKEPLTIFLLIGGILITLSILLDAFFTNYKMKRDPKTN